MIDNIKHADARIFWSVNEEDKIIALEVVEVPDGIITDCPYALNVEARHSYSSGNCYHDWDKSDVIDVILISFFMEYGFANENIAKQSMRELMKIDKFRKELMAPNRHRRFLCYWIFGLGSDQQIEEFLDTVDRFDGMVAEDE